MARKPEGRADIVIMNEPVGVRNVCILRGGGYRKMQGRLHTVEGLPLPCHILIIKVFLHKVFLHKVRILCIDFIDKQKTL